jgi:hypothetical protein
MLDLALHAQYCHGRYSSRHCVYIVLLVMRISCVVSEGSRNGSEKDQSNIRLIIWPWRSWCFSG